MTLGTKSELILALELIEREKGVPKDEILSKLQEAVASALRKHVGKNAVIECVIDPETAHITAFQVKKVVETVADPELEMPLKEAKRVKAGVEVGEDLRFSIDTEDFARIAAQTSKQVLVQFLREKERDKLFEEFKPKEGEMVSGNVHRFMERSIIIDLGKTEGILPPREQIRRERYNGGDRLRAVILKVDKAQRGPQVLLSRASPIFLRRLFELEIPEVGEKIVEVLDIARDPGFRAKVVVRSNNPKVDPVGACVGVRGSRIRAIMNEVAGERIDLILHDDDEATFLSNCMAPARVSSVRIIDRAEKRAELVVTDEQLSLAIGKEGQNIRLAAKLTGWTLDVKTEGQRHEEVRVVEQSRLADLTELEGIGPKVAEALVKAGMADIRRLCAFQAEDLMTLQGIGEKTAAKIIASARKWVDEHPEAAVAAAAPPAADAEAAAANSTSEGGPDAPAGGDVPTPPPGAE